MPDPEPLRTPADRFAELQRSEERLRLMIDAVPAMITYLDTDERFLFCNAPYLEMLGMRAEDVIGHDLNDILGDALHERLQPWRSQALAGEVARYERQHTRVDGSVRDLAVTFVPHIEDGAVVGFFCLTLDVTEVKTLERKLAHMAGHDALTGLPNRALYDDRLARAIERGRRHREPFALVFIDIDRFKQVNDTHGHAVGDQLLREFADRLRHAVRGADVAARLGGDEFALILDGPIAREGAEAVARKLMDATRAPFVLDSLTLPVTASIGVAIATDPSTTAPMLAAQADAALYRAKAQGRDTFVVHG